VAVVGAGEGVGRTVSATRGGTRRAFGQRAPVGVGVEGDDPVAAQVGEHRAECGRRGGLADPALEADDREPVTTADGRTGALDQVGAPAVSP